MFFVLTIKLASAVRPVGVRRRVVAVEVNRRTVPPVGEIAARAHRDGALYPYKFSLGVNTPKPPFYGEQKRRARNGQPESDGELLQEKQTGEQRRPLERKPPERTTLMSLLGAK